MTYENTLCLTLEKRWIHKSMIKYIKQWMIGSCGAQTFCQSKDAGPRQVISHSQFSITLLKTHVISTSILTKRPKLQAHILSYDWMDTHLLITYLTKSECVHGAMWRPSSYWNRRGTRVSERRNGLLTLKQFMQTSSSSPLKHSSKKGTKAGYHDLEAGEGFLPQSQTQNKQPLSNKKKSISTSYDFKMSSKTKAKDGHSVHSSLKERRGEGRWRTGSWQRLAGLTNSPLRTTVFEESHWEVTFVVQDPLSLTPEPPNISVQST